MLPRQAHGGEFTNFIVRPRVYCRQPAETPFKNLVCVFGEDRSFPLQTHLKNNLKYGLKLDENENII